jgi:hypothetical protein
MLHEEGHFLGLGHSDPTGGNCPVMKASYSWGSVQRTPCSDDITGVRYLYPEGSGSEPPTPTGLTASSGSDTSINVNWQNVPYEYGYEVWRANQSCSTASSGNFALIDSADADVTTYPDDWYGQGLAAGVYCYKVRAFNLNGESLFSNQDDASVGQPDGDGDGVPYDTDNCPETYNPAQEDNDGDGVPGAQPPPGATWGGDVCDEDDDNDGFADAVENYIGTDPLDDCPDVVAPESGAQCDNGLDDDGDTRVDDGCPPVGPAESGAQCENAVDDDGDTVVNDGCPPFAGHDAWPPDIYIDRSVDIIDVASYKGMLGYLQSDPEFNPRYDLNASGTVDIVDVALYKPVLGTSCAP